jgi:hypothetical protein
MARVTSATVKRKRPSESVETIRAAVASPRRGASPRRIASPRRVGSSRRARRRPAGPARRWRGWITRPRVVKKRPKAYPKMSNPRPTLRRQLLARRKAALA